MLKIFQNCRHLDQNENYKKKKKMYFCTKDPKNYSKYNYDVYFRGPY